MVVQYRGGIFCSKELPLFLIGFGSVVQCARGGCSKEFALFLIGFGGWVVCTWRRGAKKLTLFLICSGGGVHDMNKKVTKFSSEKKNNKKYFFPPGTIPRGKKSLGH